MVKRGKWGSMFSKVDVGDDSSATWCIFIVHIYINMREISNVAVMKYNGHKEKIYLGYKNDEYICGFPSILIIILSIGIIFILICMVTFSIL